MNSRFFTIAVSDRFEPTPAEGMARDDAESDLHEVCLGDARRGDGDRNVPVRLGPITDLDVL